MNWCLIGYQLSVIVDFRINWTLERGEVANLASGGGERLGVQSLLKCPFIFRLYYKRTIIKNYEPNRIHRQKTEGLE